MALQDALDYLNNGKNSQKAGEKPSPTKSESSNKNLASALDYLNS